MERGQIDEHACASRGRLCVNLQLQRAYRPVRKDHVKIKTRFLRIFHVEKKANQRVAVVVAVWQTLFELDAALMHFKGREKPAFFPIRSSQDSIGNMLLLLLENGHGANGQVVLYSSIAGDLGSIS
jgi:hypothetical protein